MYREWDFIGSKPVYRKIHRNYDLAKCNFATVKIIPYPATGRCYRRK